MMLLPPMELHQNEIYLKSRANRVVRCLTPTEFLVQQAHAVRVFLTAPLRFNSRKGARQNAFAML